MKRVLTTLILIAGLLFATWPAPAQETIASGSGTHVESRKAPQFIKRGTPLSPQEHANLEKKISESKPPSTEAGGDLDDEPDKITVAFVVLAALAATAGVAYGIYETWPFK